jgi:hypothetical protein
VPVGFFSISCSILVSFCLFLFWGDFVMIYILGAVHPLYFLNYPFFLDVTIDLVAVVCVFIIFNYLFLLLLVAVGRQFFLQFAGAGSRRFLVRRFLVGVLGSFVVVLFYRACELIFWFFVSWSYLLLDRAVSEADVYFFFSVNQWLVLSAWSFLLFLVVLGSYYTFLFWGSRFTVAGPRILLAVFIIVTNFVPFWFFFVGAELMLFCAISQRYFR